MKIHAYLICFNEERILSNILEYYLGFCSKVFVFDNGSTDRSIKIANSFEGVKVISFNTNGKLDDSKHVQIKTQAYKDYSRKGGRFTTEAADWIICCDMDEVIYHPDITSVLGHYLDLGVKVPQITGFDMVGSNEVSSSKSLLHQYDVGVRNSVYDKRGVFQADFDMSYSLGCHSYGAGFQSMKETHGYSSSNEYPIALLHYKHVGNNLYESAIRNLARFDEENITKKNDGKYTGPGSQYAYFIDKGPGFSPYKKRAKLVFNNDYSIKFDAFEATSGEVGTRDPYDKSISQKDVDDVVKAALKIKNVDLRLAYKMLVIAKRFRPSGPIINKVIDEIECELSFDID